MEGVENFMNNQIVLLKTFYKSRLQISFTKKIGLYDIVNREIVFCDVFS